MEIEADTESPRQAQGRKNKGTKKTRQKQSKGFRDANALRRRETDSERAGAREPEGGKTWRARSRASTRQSCQSHWYKGNSLASLPPIFLEKRLRTGAAGSMALGFWGQTMPDCWKSLSLYCSPCFPARVRGGGQFSETPFLNSWLAVPTLLRTRRSLAPTEQLTGR